MKGHEMLGSALRDAIARGDLEEARAAATRLGGLGLGVPPDPFWEPRLTAMRAAAARVVGAGDLGAASEGLARVAATCGDCHAAAGLRGPGAGEPAPPSPGVRPAMARHQWGAERLWGGLIFSSDDAWTAGARVLSDAPLAPELFTPGQTPAPRVAALVERVHDVGRSATAADRAERRQSVFAELMTTCGSCHQWLGGGPVAAGSSPR